MRDWIIRLSVNNCVFCRRCGSVVLSFERKRKRSMQQGSVFHQPPWVCPASAFRKLTEMNQKAFSFGLHRFERSHFSGTKSNFPSVISRVFDLRQIREWEKIIINLGWPVKKQRLSDALFFTLGWLPAPLKGGFLQRQRRWHYPFSSQLRFIENIQENAARLLSSQLACQTQTNTPITGVPTKKGNPFLAVWAYNRNLVRCNDLQRDKWSQNRCDTLNGT